MDTRKVAREYRLAQWAQVIQTRKSLGQSINEFCMSEGISKNAYFYWQRKLRDAACTGLGIQERGTEKELAPNGWTRLEASGAQGSKATLTIEVNGYRVSVDNETTSELLAKVCRTLKSL